MKGIIKLLIKTIIVITGIFLQGHIERFSIIAFIKYKNTHIMHIIQILTHSRIKKRDREAKHPNFFN